MNLTKQAIHITLSRECRDWLRQESKNTREYEGKLIEKALDFYKNNRSLVEEYKQARIFIKELVKMEMLDDFAKAKPLLIRLIHEVIKTQGVSISGSAGK